MDRETLGAFVRRIRTEKNLSCADVSKRSARQPQRRIAASYVNRIENDSKLCPTANRLKALADGLGFRRKKCSRALLDMNVKVRLLKRLN